MYTCYFYADAHYALAGAGAGSGAGAAAGGRGARVVRCLRLRRRLPVAAGPPVPRVPVKQTKY